VVVSGCAATGRPSVRGLLHDFRSNHAEAREKAVDTAREKLGYVFSFVDIGDLQRLRGGRGEFVLFSSVDYPVSENRQLQHGETGL